MTLTPGTRLGPYEVLGPLGGGGMGEVYRARDARLGREVAVKVLREDYAADPEWRARFEREARLLASLNHGNIATVHGLDESEGTRYLVMELVPGQTLADRLAEGPLPLEEALGVCRQVAEALEVAHDRGVIHRDLKPANVMITPDGKAKVLDFGLAKSTGVPAAPSDVTTPYELLTRERVIVGTVAYMAPEQARGRPLDKRCDLWALGCVLYETITGKRPFGGETYSDTLAAVLKQAPDWESLPAGVPPRVADLVRRCLQKDAKKRLRDAGDARLEIEEALAELEHPPPAPVVSAQPTRRWWPLAAAVVTASLLAFALGMGAQHLRTGAPPQAQSQGPDPNATGTPAEVPTAWTGEFLDGEATPAFGPRVSPDGQWVAYLVLQEGQTQVAVLHLHTGEKNVLTQKSDQGSPLSVCWSPDSKLIYFDRFINGPAGVFSISPLRKGGERPLPVLDAAECPQAVGESLVVCRPDDGGTHRIVRYWPDGDRPDEQFGPPVRFSMGWPCPVRALHKSNRVVFCGQLIGPDKRDDPKRRFYALDLDGATPEARAPKELWEQEVPIDLVPLAVSEDDRFLYTVLPTGDLFQLVRIPLDKSGPPEKLLTLTTRAYGLDVTPDGRLYIDQFRRPLEVLRFAADEKGPPTVVASTSKEWETSMVRPVELPGGRVVLPSKSLGRSRLLAAGAGDPEVLLPGDREESTHPATLVGANRLAFLSGPRGGRRVKVVEVAEDRVRPVRTLKQFAADGLTTLVASPRGDVLYFVRQGDVYAAAVDDTGAPRRVTNGDGVGVYPDSGDLLIQRFEKEGVRLCRIPEKGGEPTDIPVTEGKLRLAPYPLGAQAIHKDGRVLVPVTSADSWFWRVGVLQKDATLTPIPVTYEGEIFPAGWDKQDKVLAIGYPLRSELWRLDRQKPALAPK